MLGSGSGLGRGSPFCCISRCIGLSLSLSPSLFFLSALFQSTTLASDVTLLNKTAPSPRSSPQGATVQRALRQSLHALQVPSTGCFDFTSLLCPHLFSISCLVGPWGSSTPLYRLLTWVFPVKRVFTPPPPSPSSRLLLSCVDLNDCGRIDLPVLYTTRFCRDIFCRHGGHVILDLFRLYRR